MRITDLSRPPAIRSYGPSELGLRKGPEHRGGPGKPPAGFVSATTSAEEWIPYWALGTVFQDPDREHIRIPPFFGGLEWGYQIGDRELGGAVVDYVVYLPGEIVGIRLVTDFHIGNLSNPTKEASDVTQVLSLGRWMTVKDLNSQDVIEDESGAAAVSTIIDLLGGRDRLPVVVRHRRSRIGRL